MQALHPIWSTLPEDVTKLVYLISYRRFHRKEKRKKQVIFRIRSQI